MLKNISRIYHKFSMRQKNNRSKFLLFFLLTILVAYYILFNWSLANVVAYQFQGKIPFEHNIKLLFLYSLEFILLITNLYHFYNYSYNSVNVLKSKWLRLLFAVSFVMFVQITAGMIDAADDIYHDRFLGNYELYFCDNSKYLRSPVYFLVHVGMAYFYWPK
jgi:hypothetical protein